MWLDLRGRRRLSELEEKNKALEETQKRLKSEMAELATDWELWLDKINRAISRLNARTRAAATTETDDLPPPDTAASPRLGTHERMQHMRNRRHGLLSG